jgi:hypothetical protein
MGKILESHFIAKIKSRDKTSQMTGYNRITEFQFIITLYDIKSDRQHRVEIVGRWYPTARDAKLAAYNWARVLNIKLHSPSIRRCRVCGCTDDNCRQCIEKTGQPCYWVEKDLCSACVAT